MSTHPILTSVAHPTVRCRSNFSSLVPMDPNGKAPSQSSIAAARIDGRAPTREGGSAKYHEKLAGDINKRKQQILSNAAVLPVQSHIYHGEVCDEFVVCFPCQMGVRLITAWNCASWEAHATSHQHKESVRSWERVNDSWLEDADKTKMDRWTTAWGAGRLVVQKAVPNILPEFDPSSYAMDSLELRMDA
ncbi:hypothetical protein DFP72DRAFT_1076948 [Ephemerocybe angulata]|uniref:Uncharacterized protein n=1 Tax=Ephemerocybe angulata TaxID=980116 RepID=A0A8H6HEZ2_9AGAR|nr:hypothetical protein DFP72DRAFT_1076948 [Tulosesus angulatus]